MRPVEAALLFIGNPTLALEHFGESLNTKLKYLGLQFEKSSTDCGSQAVFSAPGLELIVTAKSQPLPAESFLGAMESPLSQPFRGVLSETLFRHQRHMIVSIVPEMDGATDNAIIDRLSVLRAAHTAVTLLTEWHLPAAVHWRQSNQLLMGSQYLRLAGDDTPWALFTHAQLQVSPGGALSTQRHGLRLDTAIDLIGRPIVFHETDRPQDEVHALALSFLRHTVENRSPIPDGHTFGPENGPMVRVSHIAASDKIPLGRYDLRVVDQPADRFVSVRPSAFAQRVEDLTVELPNPYYADDPREDQLSTDRSKSLAVSYLMLVILPPIGLFLFVFNTLFGVNAWRTGVIATASVALALVVGAYTFLNYIGQETAVFIDNHPIESTILAD